MTCLCCGKPGERAAWSDSCPNTYVCVDCKSLPARFEKLQRDANESNRILGDQCERAEAELDTQNRALAQCRALLKQEIDDVVPLRDKVAALEAERDALKQDAERWRKAEEIFKDMGWKERIIVCKVCDDDKCQEWHRVPTITKAIDAALAKLGD